MTKGKTKCRFRPQSCRAHKKLGSTSVITLQNLPGSPTPLWEGVALGVMVAGVFTPIPVVRPPKPREGAVG